jgi:hypothetical protein
MIHPTQQVGSALSGSGAFIFLFLWAGAGAFEADHGLKRVEPEGRAEKGSEGSDEPTGQASSAAPTSRVSATNIPYYLCPLPIPEC